MKNFESIFAAYMIGWGVFFIYQISVGQRLKKAEEELKRLKESGAKG
ncbi:MAG: hypothetical protein HY046_01375 [Acidobacteria bacterium]|nr:hypothetical protein [Acidobacteriota bacterium]